MLSRALVSVIDTVAANMAGAKSRATALRRHGCRVFIIIASALRQLRFTITTIVNLTYHKYSADEYTVNNIGRAEPRIWYCSSVLVVTHSEYEKSFRCRCILGGASMKKQDQTRES